MPTNALIVVHSLILSCIQTRTECLVCRVIVKPLTVLHVGEIEMQEVQGKGGPSASLPHMLCGFWLPPYWLWHFWLGMKQSSSKVHCVCLCVSLELTLGNP